MDLSQERCNVFMGAVCITLPVNASVTFEVPVDVARYTFNQNNRVLLRAYLQSQEDKINAPQSFDEKVEGFRVKGYKSAPDGHPRIDIILVPDVKSNGVVHVYAGVNDAERGEVARALAGMRPCRRVSPEDLSCPLQSTLGPDIVKWLEKP
ncbi:hypothetical protein [Luteibacter sp. OK325]|uniref:hypothetical protein n=1 Tax=Luteibacter sp. OK325 TaxID=2135670 RepID=UPI000D398C1C|nr:hypothetical protein [Luteibacter sp. OK325]